MINCGTTVFIFLQVVCQSLPDDNVNGKEITRLTHRWIQNTQWPTDDGTHLALRESREDMGPVTVSTTDLYAERKKKFTTTKSTVSTFKRFRTTKRFRSALEPCHYLAMDCLRAYQTDKVCGRTVYYKYFTFKNYCMMDLTNCLLRYQFWRVSHMGDCFYLKELTALVPMPYYSSHLMDDVYVADAI